MFFPIGRWYRLGSPEREPVKPQERDELAKNQKLEVIQAELAQHGRAVRLTLLLVTLLSALVLAVLLYLLLGRA
jgi:hypothetical protein